MDVTQMMWKKFIALLFMFIKKKAEKYLNLLNKMEERGK